MKGGQMNEWGMNFVWMIDESFMRGGPLFNWLMIHWMNDELWNHGWMLDECWMNEKANVCWMDYERMNDQYWISVLDINDRWMIDESFMKYRWMLKKRSILWMMNELGMQDALILYCINERWMNTKKHGCKSIWYVVQSSYRF
jgi:hypothetical protein